MSHIKKEFASKCLFEFMSAINNYNLHKSCHDLIISASRNNWINLLYKLIKYATNICVAYSLSDFDAIHKSYKRFTKLLIKYELHGTSDMCNPIDKIVKIVKLA